MKLINKKYRWWILVVVFSFIINEMFRANVLSIISEKLYTISKINILLIIGLFFIIINKNVKFKKNPVIVIVFFLLPLFTITLITTNNLKDYIFVIFCIIIPMFIMSIRDSDINSELWSENFLKIINIFTIVLFVILIVDYLLDSKLQVILANYLTLPNWKQLILSEVNIERYRFYSIWGHPLQNSKIFLLFYLVNSTYMHYKNKIMINKLSVIGISVIGVILSGSKLALLLLLVAVAIDIMKNGKKILYKIFTVIFIISILNSNLFINNLLTRFKASDLSSGRNKLIVNLIESKSEKPNWIIGKGPGYSRELTGEMFGENYNFEYPILMFSYDYGILATGLIYLIIFLYPLFKLIKLKSYFALVCFLLIHIYLNGSNGLANFSDVMTQLILCNLYFININNKRGGL